MRLNDLGGAIDETIRQSASPALMAFIIVISRSIYKRGRKKWRVTISEAIIISISTATIGPVLLFFNLHPQLAYPFGVFVGYVGIDRFSIWICKKLGVD